MLKNLDSLPLDRIHHMLKMFAFQGLTTECSPSELKVFLDRKVRERLLIFSNNMYKLHKWWQRSVSVQMFQQESLFFINNKEFVFLKLFIVDHVHWKKLSSFLHSRKRRNRRTKRVVNVSMLVKCQFWKTSVCRFCVWNKFCLLCIVYCLPRKKTVIAETVTFFFALSFFVDAKTLYWKSRKVFRLIIRRPECLRR